MSSSSSSDSRIEDSGEHQHENGAEDRGEEAACLQLGPSIVHQVPDGPADDGTDDPETDSAEAPQIVRPFDKRLRDEADEKTADDPRDESHGKTIPQRSERSQAGGVRSGC